ncbi:MAG: adenylate/guanylate cyclase domain-containing protein [Pseudohongiellaceae bacterium]
MFAFRTFRTRLIIFLLILLLPVLGGSFYYVNQNSQQYTDQTINHYLQQGANVFDYTRREQSQTLLAIMSSLTWDYGFRAAYGTQDTATIYDAALNVLSRSMGSVDMLMITDLSGYVVIDTQLQGFTNLTGPWSELLDTARQDNEGRATGIIMIGDMPFQVLAVPLYLPRQVAWIIGGFALDQDFVETVKNNTSSEISLVRYNEPYLEVIATTLDEVSETMLQRELDVEMLSQNTPRRVTLSSEEFGTLPRRLSTASDGSEVLMLIQRSYSENMANQERFEASLVTFYALALVASLAAVLLLARSITHPLQRLAVMVSKIEQGDFDQRVHLRARDELGQLAYSVNSMAAGLEEKEKVRDMLGKVVSRQIAEELLKRPVRLAGEEKIVTIMFADIRGFTTYCEKHQPHEILPTLNKFLSTISRIVDANNGIIDKYNGDSVMALFAVPLTSDQDANNAMKAGLEIIAELPHIGSDETFMATGVDGSIGIHTGLVVAGNLGSPDRLNYSVIGDPVNLAARLESLTRLYEVSNIVSGESRAAAPDFIYREMDRVRVFGKTTPVIMYELVGKPESVSATQLAKIARYESALAHYRQQHWDEAEAEFQKMLEDEIYQGQCRLFLIRIRQFRKSPPPADWEGIYAFDRKA